jgi:hypothetical protein
MLEDQTYLCFADDLLLFLIANLKLNNTIKTVLQIRVRFIVEVYLS